MSQQNEWITIVPAPLKKIEWLKKRSIRQWHMYGQTEEENTRMSTQWEIPLPNCEVDSPEYKAFVRTLSAPEARNGTRSDTDGTNENVAPTAALSSSSSAAPQSELSPVLTEEGTSASSERTYPTTEETLSAPTQGASGASDLRNATSAAEVSRMRDAVSASDPMKGDSLSMAMGQPDFCVSPRHGSAANHVLQNGTTDLQNCSEIPLLQMMRARIEKQIQELKKNEPGYESPETTLANAVDNPGMLYTPSVPVYTNDIYETMQNSEPTDAHDDTGEMPASVSADALQILETAVASAPVDDFINLNTEEEHVRGIDTTIADIVTSGESRDEETASGDSTANKRSQRATGGRGTYTAAGAKRKRYASNSPASVRARKCAHARRSRATKKLRHVTLHDLRDALAGHNRYLRRLCQIENVPVVQGGLAVPQSDARPAETHGDGGNDTKSKEMREKVASKGTSAIREHIASVTLQTVLGGREFCPSQYIEKTVRLWQDPWYEASQKGK